MILQGLRTLWFELVKVKVVFVKCRAFGRCGRFDTEPAELVYSNRQVMRRGAPGLSASCSIGDLERLDSVGIYKYQFPIYHIYYEFPVLIQVFPVHHCL